MFLNKLRTAIWFGLLLLIGFIGQLMAPSVYKPHMRLLFGQDVEVVTQNLGQTVTSTGSFATQVKTSFEANGEPIDSWVVLLSFLAFYGAIALLPKLISFGFHSMTKRKKALNSLPKLLAKRMGLIDWSSNWSADKFGLAATLVIVTISIMMGVGMVLQLPKDFINYFAFVLLSPALLKVAGFIWKDFGPMSHAEYLILRNGGRESLIGDIEFDLKVEVEKVLKYLGGQLQTVSLSQIQENTRLSQSVLKEHLPKMETLGLITQSGSFEITYLGNAVMQNRIRKGGKR